MKRPIITLLLVLLAATAIAQGRDDAFLYAQTQYQGTAKALGMGNALGAIGGDMTSSSINPAGLGIYRNSELAFSLGLLDNYHSSTYYGNEAHGNTLRMNIPNLGYVGVKQRSNFRPTRFTQFAITFNRLNDYNIHSFAKGINPSSSLIDNYIGRIGDYYESELSIAFPYDIYPAYQTNLINKIGQYYDSPVPQGGIWQEQEKDYTGRSEEWGFSGSANLMDKLYLGMSLNITHIKRRGSCIFTESMPDNSDIDTDFNRWQFMENLSSNGTGINAKLGIIWHVSPWLRLGGAFHSPSRYAFDESWQTETESQINWVTRKYISPESHYEYTYISPLKWVGSMAFVIGQYGMVSLDAEYTNYAAARFSAKDYDYKDINANIKETFGKTINLRIGTEWRLSETYLRLGAGYYGSPYGLGDTSGSVKKASVGLSVPASNSIIFDFGYELSIGKQYFRLYDYDPIQPVEQSQLRNLFLVTMRIHP